MMPSRVSRLIVGERLRLIHDHLQHIRALPLADSAVFLQDQRNVAAAESMLRRALEALLDIGRHLLAKGFGAPTTEYKQIAVKLREHKVLTQAEGDILFALAGYRNLVVHLYYEVALEELYRICSTQLSDVEQVANAYRTWMKANPQLVSDEL
ncbi:MAG: DUF86 domain-containing protein [Roseiflexaceae bacterium]|nr:DUF86 domain-containing protein [Roseiflexaceae bacterium]